jgi:hypothetical protein
MAPRAALRLFLPLLAASAVMVVSHGNWFVAIPVAAVVLIALVAPRLAARLLANVISGAMKSAEFVPPLLARARLSFLLCRPTLWAVSAGVAGRPPAPDQAPPAPRPRAFTRDAIGLTAEYDLAPGTTHDEWNSRSLASALRTNHRIVVTRTGGNRVALRLLLVDPLTADRIPLDRPEHDPDGEPWFDRRLFNRDDEPGT